MSALAWSLTRYGALRECARMYWYRYYAGYDEEFGAERVRRLAALVSVPLVVGQVVHEVIGRLLERLRRSDAALDMARFAAYTESVFGKLWVPERMVEAHYGGRVPAAEEELRRVRGCLESFLGSPRFGWLKAQPLEERDSWVVESPDLGRSTVEGVPAYFKVDLVVPFGDGVVVLDWKTGRRTAGRERQMAAYAVWATRVAGFDASEVVTVLAFLGSVYEEEERRFGEEELEAFTEGIRREYEELRSYCADAERNVPKGKEVFAMTEDLSLCGRCNFRELCGR